MDYSQHKVSLFDIMKKLKMKTSSMIKARKGGKVVQHKPEIKSSLDFCYQGKTVKQI